MNFRCSELQGAIYQPKEILEIANCWIIPACKGGLVLEIPDCKLIFVYQENTAKGNEALEEYLFVLCYQFLFCNTSDVYQFYSLRQLNRSEPSVLSGEDISDVEKQIRNKYVQQGNTFAGDFTNIESFYTSFPHPVNFQEFYGKFTELFRKEREFREIVTLFCETVNGLKPLYKNVLQQFAQLQTIFETLLGNPKSLECSHCGMSHYVEDWDVFLEKRLKEYGITDPDEICLMTKIKKKLNKLARVKYVHHAKYYNPNELRHFIADIKADRYSDYKFNINQVLKKDPISWSSIDWVNVHGFYLVIVRYLIYLEYF